jgi:ribosomal-protein-serine acetyltransferase
MAVSIRKYKESDAEAFQAAVLDSFGHLSPWMAWCTPDYSISDARAWASSAASTWRDGTDYRFVVEDAETAQILGSVGFNQIVSQHKVGNLGYWIRESAINRGVCTTAARQAVQYAFQELGFHRIEIHILIDNHASNAVAVKLGATYEGTFRNKLFHNGSSLPAKCYSIIPADYEL